MYLLAHERDSSLNPWFDQLDQHHIGRQKRAGPDRFLFSVTTHNKGNEQLRLSCLRGASSVMDNRENRLFPSAYPPPYPYRPPILIWATERERAINKSTRTHVNRQHYVKVSNKRILNQSNRTTDTLGTHRWYKYRTEVNLELSLMIVFKQHVNNVYIFSCDMQVVSNRKTIKRDDR